MNWLINPVTIVRYFEFDFAFRQLKDVRGTALDLSSPRLFSLFMAEKIMSRVEMLNPDADDLNHTRDAAHRLGIRNLACEKGGADRLQSRPEHYDAIWSISVMEHIHGDYDDSKAMQWAWNALKKGGRLVVTVPVMPVFTIETMDTDLYGTQKPMENGKYFFQRFYDQSAIRSRLIDAIGKEPESCEIFGEKVAGFYAKYEANWRRLGQEVTVQDPRLIADEFQFYTGWDSLPGIGIIGLCFTK